MHGVTGGERWEERFDVGWVKFFLSVAREWYSCGSRGPVLQGMSDSLIFGKSHPGACRAARCYGTNVGGEKARSNSGCTNGDSFADCFLSRGLFVISWILNLLSCI